MLSAASFICTNTDGTDTCVSDEKCNDTAAYLPDLVFTIDGNFYIGTGFVDGLVVLTIPTSNYLW
jgi:hypothetical protein